MRTRIVLLAAAIATGAALSAACSSGGGQQSAVLGQQTAAAETTAGQSGQGPAADGQGAAGGADGKTVITVWTKDRHDQEFMQAICDKLNQEYDDMQVVYEMYTDNYSQTVEIAASTNELPDVLVLQSQIVDSLLPRDMFYYMDGLMPADFRARFDDSMFVEGINTKGGKIFSLPNTGVTLRLVYNKDIFERVGLPGPPETVRQMAEYAKKITDELSGEGIYGFALPLKNPASGLSRGFRSIPQLSGYPVWEGFDFSQGKYDWAAYKPAVEAMREIFSGGAAFPGCESLDIDPLRTQFADGKIGMYMTYSHSEWGVYKNQFPTEQDWGYAMLPTYDGEVKGSQWVETGFWYAITSACEEPEKAWRVIEAFYDVGNQTAYYEQGLGVTVLEDVQQAAAAPESIAYLPYMAIQPTDKMWPLPPTALTIEGDDWGTVFASIIFGARNDIDAAIQELNDRYNAAYEKGIADGTHKAIHYPSFNAADPIATAN